MKFKHYFLLTMVLLVGGLGVYATGAKALERTISVDEINYVSLQQMAVKYNLAVQEENDSVRLNGDSVNLVISKTTNLFTLNGKEYYGQETAKKKENETWITAKDWATIFNLTLTHYDGVSEMTPAPSEPVLNNEPFDDGTYRISSDWGEKTPDSVRIHGNITEITTPIIEFPLYDDVHRNMELESDSNIQTP